MSDDSQRPDLERGSVPYGDPLPARPAPAELSTDGSLSPGPDHVERLEAPPRGLPPSLRLGFLSFALWETFAVVVALVAPMVLWIFVPVLFPPVAALVVGAAMTWRWRRHRSRVRLLRWGRVAQVTNGPEAATGRPTSTTYRNVSMRQARGWTVTRRRYTGRGHVSDIAWAVDTTTGTLQLKGLPYVGGVVLVDPREPVVALEITQLPFDVRPGPDGALTVSFGVARMLGMVVTVAVYAAVLAAAVVVAATVY